MSLPETDWKQLTRLKPLALERLCRRILEEAQALIAAAGEGDSHRVYLALFNQIQKNDRLIADSFDHWSRSRAIEHLAVWRGHNLVTDEEFAAFSPETRAAAEFWLSGPP
jgi:hypothetical protein